MHITPDVNWRMHWSEHGGNKIKKKRSIVQEAYLVSSPNITITLVESVPV